MRVLVIGSGLAGLEAALTAHESGHDVTVLTKGVLTDSATAWAQGGIAAAVGADDTPALHAADTMRASAGLAEPRAVDVLVSEGPERVRELAHRGVRFDLDSSGELARGREAAHSLARVVHAGGDATGREIERALVAELQASSIDWHERSALLDLIIEDGRAVGALTLNDAGERREWHADAIILATGGAGQVYQFTTNPMIATGDGLAAAIRAGAQVEDLEFVQFHPTALAVEHLELISEAVRGDGAVLRNAAGERFMLTVHADAELAPRDVVARAVAREMEHDGRPVWLDATAIRPAAENAEYLAKRFPSIDAACHANGFEWSREWIPVTPAAHYVMGGIATDLDGHTSIPGLWAVGEVARTGVHGANRLASNSLLEAAVFGRRAAVSLGAATDTSTPMRSPARTQLTQDSNLANIAAPSIRADLQRLMWTQAGLLRDEHGLRAAGKQIQAWLRDTPAPTTITQLEDRNLLIVANAIVQAALERAESVGAHFRTDDVATGTIPVQERQHA